ncbi:hypothetical protein QBC40DRAFT_284482 [Triangularia verruculosa]|uniref:Uncharacterized protein n=1 Tax=Triangularia verruculosa TaxID=2587418 RepID=A0AAN6XC93_9PEZI|nr:hypothetical protein QBC40DRAFT_284482 [Triangularia verruculosa]
MIQEESKKSLCCQEPLVLSSLPVLCDTQALAPTLPILTPSVNMAFTIDQTKYAWSGLLCRLERQPGPLHSTGEAIVFTMLIFIPFLIQYHVGLFIQNHLRICQRAQQKQCSSGPVAHQYPDR